MEDNKSVETPKKIASPVITVPKPRPQIHHQNHNHHRQQQQKNSQNSPSLKLPPGSSKYAELLHVIEDLGHHIRPSYAGHRGSAEKVRQGIIKARVLVRESLIETERSSRQ